MFATLLLIFLLFMGCQGGEPLLEPEAFADKGLSLGASKTQVTRKLGKAQVELNYRWQGHLVCVCEYDRHLLDYNPIYDRDDVGILAPSPGFHDVQCRDYRLGFIDGRLYSIEDFRRNRYYSLPAQSQEIEFILDRIKQYR